MKRSMIAIVLCLVGTSAHAQGMDDLMACNAIAKKYVSSPSTLTMGELVTLRDCLQWQMGIMAQEAENARVGKAIERNFGGARTLTDAE